MLVKSAPKISTGEYDSVVQCVNEQVAGHPLIPRHGWQKHFSKDKQRRAVSRRARDKNNATCAKTATDPQSRRAAGSVRAVRHTSPSARIRRYVVQATYFGLYYAT